MGCLPHADHDKQYVFNSSFFFFLLPFSSKILTNRLSHPLTLLLFAFLSLFYFFDSAAFDAARLFNSDVSKWDVSRLTTSVNMFLSALSFNRTWCYEDFPPWKGKIGPTDFKWSKASLFCCPPGKFHKPSSTDLFFCAACQKGQYTNISSLPTTCDKCPRGFTAAALGTAECGECELETFSNVDRSKCSVCGAGLYQFDGVEESSCKNCTKAKYQDFGGQKECKDCPAGWYQSQQAKPFCLPCIPVSDFFFFDIFLRTGSRLLFFF